PRLRTACVLRHPSDVLSIPRQVPVHAVEMDQKISYRTKLAISPRRKQLQWLTNPENWTGHSAPATRKRAPVNLQFRNERSKRTTKTASFGAAWWSASREDYPSTSAFAPSFRVRRLMSGPSRISTPTGAKRLNAA